MVAQISRETFNRTSLTPPMEDSDSDDLVLALETARALEAQGEIREAARWLRRAAEQAETDGNDARVLVLARAAADLTNTIAPASTPTPAPSSLPPSNAAERSGVRFPAPKPAAWEHAAPPAPRTPAPQAPSRPPSAPAPVSARVSSPPPVPARLSPRFPRAFHLLARPPRRRLRRAQWPPSRRLCARPQLRRARTLRPPRLRPRHRRQLGPRFPRGLRRRQPRCALQSPRRIEMRASSWSAD